MTPAAGRFLIAIVDDEPNHSLPFQDMLTLIDVDVDVELFTAGDDFLRSANLAKFESMIPDLSLPDMDGFELMDRMAAIAIGTSITVTSGHNLATIDAARICGKGIGLDMHGTLPKPFSRDELFSGLGLAV